MATRVTKSEYLLGIGWRKSLFWFRLIDGGDDETLMKRFGSSEGEAAEEFGFID